MTDVASQRKHRVLVLDDEEKVADAIGRALSHSVDQTCSCAPATQRLLQPDFDTAMQPHRADLLLCPVSTNELDHEA